MAIRCPAVPVSAFVLCLPALFTHGRTCEDSGCNQICIAASSSDSIAAPIQVPKQTLPHVSPCKSPCRQLFRITTSDVNPSELQGLTRCGIIRELEGMPRPCLALVSLGCSLEHELIGNDGTGPLRLHNHTCDSQSLAFASIYSLQRVVCSTLVAIGRSVAVWRCDAC